MADGLMADGLMADGLIGTREEAGGGPVRRLEVN